VIGSTTVGGDGKWSYTPSTDLSSGSHDLYVIETNPAGTASAPSTHISFSVVPGPVETVTITNLIDHTSGGSVSIPNGGSTYDKSPAVQGTISSNLLAGETVVVYRDGVKVGTATVNGRSWSYADLNVSNAPHTYTARVETTSTQGKFSDPFSFTELHSLEGTGMALNMGALYESYLKIDASLNLVKVFLSGFTTDPIVFNKYIADPSFMFTDWIKAIGTNGWSSKVQMPSSLPAYLVGTIYGYDAQNNRIEIASFTAGWVYNHLPPKYWGGGGVS
jgi:hypothetical protein